MENLTELASVPVIAAIVYGVLFLYKSIVKKEILIKLIPVIGAALGTVLGIVAFYAAPEIMPASNILAAILVGGASGLSATGINQIYKQFTKCPDNSEACSDVTQEEAPAQKTEAKDAEEDLTKKDNEK